MNDEERAAIEGALRDLDYPAPRNKLVSVAMANGVSRQVLDRILELPETADFHDAEQLRAALGVDVPGVRPDGGWE